MSCAVAELRSATPATMTGEGDDMLMSTHEAIVSRETGVLKPYFFFLAAFLAPFFAVPLAPAL